MNQISESRKKYLKNIFNNNNEYEHFDGIILSNMRNPEREENIKFIAEKLDLSQNEEKYIVNHMFNYEGIKDELYMNVIFYFARKYKKIYHNVDKIERRPEILIDYIFNLCDLPTNDKILKTKRLYFWFYMINTESVKIKNVQDMFLHNIQKNPSKILLSYDDNLLQMIFSTNRVN